MSGSWDDPYGSGSSKGHQDLRDEVSDYNPQIDDVPVHCGLDSMRDDDFDIGGDEEEVVPEARKRSRKEISSRSPYWLHFEKFMCKVDKIQKAKCIYCEAIIKADPKAHGTNPLKNHFDCCKKKPDEVATNQARMAFQSSHGRVHLPWKFDQDKTREALCHWLIVDELPFKTIENPGFKHFMSVACPVFAIPSRRTITKDIFNMYVNERTKLKSFIRNHAQRVSITTDTWTSIQKVNYMCLTAHFIDDDWNLQKRILNFCPISGHKSEEVGKSVEKCLLDWGIDKIFTVTVDNASSNDGAILYLQKKFENWGANILGGKYVHMRCVAHIINLIVQDGLKSKDEDSAITCIRGAIRYIRNSPARYKKFVECVEIEKLETNKLLILDVPTRWNSTYLMLESATCLRRAFDAYEDMDFGYVNELSKAPYDGVPRSEHWDKVKLLLKFLGHFYRLTLCISGSLYVTSNIVFHEITSVDMLLRQWMNSENNPERAEVTELKAMSKKMKDKFDKYWGSIEKMNMILYYAVILDPRHKLDFIDFSFDKLYGDISKNQMMKEKVKHGMQELFHDYKMRYGLPESPLISLPVSSSGASLSPSFDHGTYLKDQYRKQKRGGKRNSIKSELERYLGEDLEDDTEEFDILKWWKLNSPRFPVLSKLARDILAVPVSTVASEAAFSTRGRVLDAFRSSLSPKIVQALVCAQDWLRLNNTPINVEEDLYEIETIEKELTRLGVDSTIIDI